MSDSLDTRLEALTEADFKRGMEVFRAKLTEGEAAFLDTCVRCGLCAQSCHYYRADAVPENVPAAKLEVIASAFRHQFTTLGRIAPAMFGARAFDKEMAKAWIDAVFGRCSLCGRCSLNCTTGILLPRLFRAARAALAAMGLTPTEVQAAVDMSVRHGNNMGITKEDWIETVQWIEEELQMETGDPDAKLPLDKEGAKILFTVNPREPKFFPLSLQASAKVFWAAKEDWTLASEGWDLTNYGLFTCKDDDAGLISQQLVDAMTRLGCETLVIGECGHGFASARWEAPEWLGAALPFKVKSMVELMDDYLREGRIQVDPARNPKPVTVHDPCNLVRHGGICDAHHRVVKASAQACVEMMPNRAHAFCCGGGGGQLAMGQYKARRLKAGGVKAEQIRATQAQVVVAPCHNCVDQLGELNKEYKLGVQVKTVAELVADALV